MSSDSTLLKKGLMILMSFKDAPMGQSISEISRKVELPFSTTSRILKALEGEGFLERNSDKQYQLGLNCYFLGTLARKSGLLRRIALPHMEELRARFEETVILYVRKGDIRVYYSQLAGPQSLKRTEDIGTTAPLWAGSASRCLLACTDEEEIRRILQDIRPLCVNTMTDKELILARIREIRNTGYDISVSEREEGVCSVSSPIMETSSRVGACITITGPAVRFTKEVLSRMIPAVKAAASGISAQLQQAPRERKTHGDS